MEATELSLQELYTKGLEAMQKAQDMPRCDTRQDLYLESRRLFELALNLTESLSLFSDNETIDDVATSNLRYLLIPAYVAKVLISSECTFNRLDTFVKAEAHIKKFFDRILKYGLGNECIEQSLESDKSSCTKSLGTDLESAMRTRNDKIERYKKMKLLESEIAELDRQIKCAQHFDEEIERRYYLNLIKKWTEDTLESLEQEVRPALLFERSSESQESEPSSTSSRHKPTNSKLPTTITIVKNEIQKKVFGIGYPSRPTVTVDEFISKKIKDGDLAFEAHKEVYANSLQRYAEKPDLLREQEELSDVEREEKEEREDEDELNRKRNWDEFKDDNPRGSGNRHNMG